VERRTAVQADTNVLLRSIKAFAVLRNRKALFGRALVVVAAEQYAARMVLPSSQRTYRMHWGSHEDIAAKALKKLVGPHLPASLRTLERAVERVHAEHREAIDQIATASSGVVEPDESVEPEPGEELEPEPNDEPDGASETTVRRQ
jgi:hypothetical protein